MYDYAKCFKRDENIGKLVYDNCPLNLNSYNAARFLLANFLRKQHAKRAKDVMSGVFTYVDWDIKRLYDLILDECLMHGASFSEVMSKPRFEKGIGDDTCHPRFVSCLLRLGDLLDFDSSRISRYLLKHLSDSIPGDSKNHVKKHASIKHIDISTEKIEAIAECEDCDTAMEVDAWFSWIKDELSNQRNQWYEIVPKNISQSLPSFNDVQIRLKNGYDDLDGKYQSSFEIDAKKTVELLQGSNIYQDKSKCFRELLQNAIDATFIRVCLECKDKITNDKNGYEKFKNILNSDADYLDNDKYAIDVSLKKYGSGWHFTIADHGVGISKNDLTYLLKIGSSTQNVERKKIIDSMPEFAKPSGVFGIGFQSVFLLAEKVTLRTRRFDDGDCIKVELNSPLKSGFVALRTSEGRLKPYGTIIEFEINDTSLFKKNIKGYNTEFKMKSSKYDFIENSEDELFEAMVRDEIVHFAYDSIVPIYFNGELVSKRQDCHFYKENNIIIEIRYVTKDDLLFRDNGSFQSENMVVSFRSAVVENLSYVNSIKFLPLKVNVLSGNALDILPLSRESFKREYEIQLTEVVKRAGVEYLNGVIESINDDDYRIIASMFLEYYSENNCHKEWENLPLNKDFSLKSFIDSKYDLIVSGFNVKVEMGESIQLDFDDPKAILLVHVLRRQKGYKLKYYAVDSMYGSKSSVFVFSAKLDSDEVCWKSWLQLYRQRKSIRSLMPCIGFKSKERVEFEKLQINENKLNGVRLGFDPMNRFEKVVYPRMVCPVVVDENGELKWSVSDKLYQWVYDNQKEEKKVTIDEIKELYGKIKEIFDKTGEIKKD